MEIKTFQNKLAELCKLAEEHGKVLKGEEIREFFEGLELEKDQLVPIFRYLKSQGISVEGISDPGAAEQGNREGGSGHSVEAGRPLENPCLTPEDREYLKNYKKGLREAAKGQEPRLAKFLPVAADLAAELFRDGMILSDLIQEANLSLVTILAGDSEALTDEELEKHLRKGVKEAADCQDEQKFGDDYLVAKVQNLDNVMKDLTEEDGGDPKFSVEELAIMLDMDIDEMKDVIRLTGTM